MIVYKDGLKFEGLFENNIHTIAGSGSCKDEAGNEVGCEPLIEASTPQKLKTELQS